MQVPEIEIAEFAARWAEGAIVVDVREVAEYREAHVPGARLIPLATVGDRLDELPSDFPVYVICRSGARSLAAAEVMRGKGIEAINVAGGTLGWIDSGGPIVAGDEAG